MLLSIQQGPIGEKQKAVPTGQTENLECGLVSTFCGFFSLQFLRSQYIYIKRILSVAY